eukprot:718947-Rhodomonas_salina.1
MRDAGRNGHDDGSRDAMVGGGCEGDRDDEVGEEEEEEEEEEEDGGSGGEVEDGEVGEGGG